MLKMICSLFGEANINFETENCLENRRKGEINERNHIRDTGD